MRAGESFLLDGIVSRPLTDTSAHGQDLGASANGDALTALPASSYSSPTARGGRGSSGGGGGGGSGGVMLRMLGGSAQDTLNSMTGRAAAAEWAHQQVHQALACFHRLQRQTADQQLEACQRPGLEARHQQCQNLL